jgi:predicted amidohydrolase YtcJ
MTIAPDLIVHNGNLITLDSERLRAPAMAIRDGRIVAVGSDHEILPLAASRTTRLDLAGKTVVPGFCDSHIHLLWYGMQLLKQADLVGTSTVDEFCRASRSLRRSSTMAGSRVTASIRTSSARNASPPARTWIECRGRGQSSSRASAATRSSSIRGARAGDG